MLEETSLLDLPYEIRYQIYEQLLGARGEIRVGRIKADVVEPGCDEAVKRSLGLLFACKPLYNEFSRFLYSHTIFDLEDAADGIVQFLQQTPPHLLASIRCVNYNHCDTIPLTDKFPSKLKQLMQKADQDDVRKCAANFKTIFQLITEKLTGSELLPDSTRKVLTLPGLEALIIRLSIYSNVYHGDWSYFHQCQHDPVPYVETLCQVRTLDIPYVSLKLFTVCSRLRRNTIRGLACLGFTICGVSGRAEWLEDMMKGNKRMTWSYLRPLMELKARDDEDEYLFCLGRC
ncbi:MAG: hypothetical protein LQ340_000782 [Diploschistes diacapsis]|nr:MAG: hypothetical protein LQ340_000782 [Diploschistes diacapsis]